MAISQTDIDRLEKALMSDSLEVTFEDGSRVRFHNADELMARIQYARKLLDTSRDAKRTQFIRYTKGVRA